MRVTGRQRRALLWSAGAAVVALGVVVAVVALSGGSAPPAATATTTVARGTVTLAVSASGTVSAASTRSLAFSVAGTVTEVDVKAGDVVKAGQVLARVDPTDAQATVDSAQNRVSDATDAVDRAQQTADLPICPSATATTSAPRGPGGSGSGGGGSAAGGSGTGAGAGGSAGDTAAAAEKCTPAGRTSTTDQLLSAQQQLNNANLALVQARARLAGTVITAPLAGRVLSVAGKVGGSASAGGSGFVVLGDVSSLSVTAQFSEADVGRIAVGQTASIVLPDRAQPVAGTVAQVDPAGTVSGRLVRYGVLVTFAEIPDDLLLGQSATVTVTTASAADVLYASSAAVTGIVDGMGRVTVRVAGKDETRTVTVGLRGDQYTELKTGVGVGDTLVLPTAGV